MNTKTFIGYKKGITFKFVCPYCNTIHTFDHDEFDYVYYNYEQKSYNVFCTSCYKDLDTTEFRETDDLMQFVANRNSKECLSISRKTNNTDIENSETDTLKNSAPHISFKDSFRFCRELGCSEKAIREYCAPELMGLCIPKTKLLNKINSSFINKAYSNKPEDINEINQAVEDYLSK